MSELRYAADIHQDFFCDGPYYFLTSSSLGGSQFSPKEISDEYLQSTEGVISLLENGVGLPLFFPGDCALDSCTRFVYGELTEEEQHNWVGKLSAKLKVPCGKVILLAGGGDADYLAYALAGKEPDPHYRCYDFFDIPTGDYLVELYCYLGSMSFAVECEDNESWFRKHFKDIGIGYLFHFQPLTQEPDLPELVDDVSWCGVFAYRHPSESSLNMPQSHHS